MCVPHDIRFDVVDVFVGVREKLEELSQYEGEESDEGGEAHILKDLSDKKEMFQYDMVTSRQSSAVRVHLDGREKLGHCWSL